MDTAEIMKIKFDSGNVDINNKNLKSAVYGSKRQARMSQDTINIVRTLHRRFHHELSPVQMKNAIENTIWINIPREINVEDIMDIYLLSVSVWHAV